MNDPVKEVQEHEWHVTKATVDNVSNWGMILPAMVVLGVIAMIIEAAVR